jgi:hypothetical protein
MRHAAAADVALILAVVASIAALIVVLAVVYSRQRRNRPYDIEGARKAGTQGPHGYSNTLGQTGDIGGGGAG